MYIHLAVKNIKEHADMSHETNCFSATIYLEGKRVGHVSNRGNGGCNDYHWIDQEAAHTIALFADEQCLEFDFERVDQLIDQLLNEAAETKQLKRLAKKSAPFRLKGDDIGSWRTLGVPAKDPRVLPHLQQKYGDKLERIFTA